MTNPAVPPCHRARPRTSSPNCAAPWATVCTAAYYGWRVWLAADDAQKGGITAQREQTASTLRGDAANLSYTKIYAPIAGTVVSQTAKQGQTLNANQQAPIILRIADLSVMTVQAQVSEADVPKLKLGMAVYFTTLGAAAVATTVACARSPVRRWLTTSFCTTLCSTFPIRVRP